MMGSRLSLPSIQHPTLKGWYLVFSASLAFFLPHLNLYYRHQGYSEDVIGYLSGMRKVVFASSAPLIAAFADKTRKYRLILLSCILISTPIRAAIWTTGTLWLLVAFLVLGEIMAAPIVSIAEAAAVSVCAEDGSYGKQRLWGSIGWGGANAVSGYLVSKFGVSVLSIAYPVMNALSFFVGCKMDMTRLTSSVPETQKTESPATKVDLKEAELTEITTVTERYKADDNLNNCENGAEPDRISKDLVNDERKEVSKVPTAENENNLEGENVSDKNTKCEGGVTGENSDVSDNQMEKKNKPLTSMLTKEVYIFLLMAFFMGIGNGVIENFLFLYLEELGAKQVLMGLTITVSCAAEVPVFFFMDRILKTLGTFGTLQLAMITFSVRLLAYPMLLWSGSAWKVLIIEPLHSITFACAWGAGTDYSKKIAPPGLDATLQSVFSSLYSGIGNGFGALVGGQIYKYFGARIMFFSASGVIGVVWMFCMLMTVRFGEIRKQQA